jgi:cation diffusion facilitator family transporter
MLVSGCLAVAKIAIGLHAGSTSVVADGVESASDVLASGIVIFGLALASRPADKDHPYGYGRFETLTGLGLGVILAVTGLLISLRSVAALREVHPPPASYVVLPLVASILVKFWLARLKFRTSARIRSAALRADAWNDSVDILSASSALIAVGLTIYDPSRFLAADHYGGFVVGVLVIFLGMRVVRDTSLQLLDTMPDEETMRRIRQVAQTVPGALAVEKCFARKTGLKYHVDLHLEVDPELTVRESHEIATQVRFRIIEELRWVADVLVHVEPFTP